MRTTRGKTQKARYTNKSGEQAIKSQKARARARMDAIRNRQRTETDIIHANAVITGLVPRIQGAVDSWCRKRVPMKVNLHASGFYAATDFQQIILSLPEDEVSVDFVADFRGLAYHECGHIVMTTPLANLVKAMGCTLAAGLSPATTAERINEWLTDHHHGMALYTFQRAWNILEDQRMETAMVRVSKNLAAYYDVIVLAHVLGEGIMDASHLYLYGRHHVDADVRAVARRKMAKVHGQTAVDTAEQIISTYTAATELPVMFQAVIDFVALMESIHFDATFNLDEHQQASPVGSGEAGDKADQSATPTQADDTVEADDEDPDDEAMEQALQDALDEAREQRNRDGNLTNDVRSYNESKAAGRSGTPLERLTPIPNLDSVDIGRATKLNRAVRNLMEQARAEKAPSWQNGLRTGVLDVIRYKTRQPGDMEFFRNFAPGGDVQYPNLAVSVVLDGSGSMGSHDKALGIAAFGMKSACDVAHVPCTVMVYDSNAYVLYEQDDRPLDVPMKFVPNGGTDPTEALNMLDGQMADKARHLVIIMTDGQWQGGWNTTKSLADYALPTRDVVIFYYRTGITSIMGQETCENVRISDLDEMPRHLARHIMKAL